MNSRAASDLQQVIFGVEDRHFAFITSARRDTVMPGN
jgi:hypothetical protein